MKRTTALIVTSSLVAGISAAQEPHSAKTTAYQTSVSQEQLRASTRRLKTEMVGLLDEYGQYQAATGELAKLKNALGQLDTVSENDMLAVVKILRDASRMEKGDDTKAKLVEASSGRVIGRKTCDRHRSEIAAFRLDMTPRFCMVGMS